MGGGLIQHGGGGCREPVLVMVWHQSCTVWQLILKFWHKTICVQTDNKKSPDSHY